MRKRAKWVAAAGLAIVGGLVAAASSAQVPSATGWLHGITLLGELKYPPGFEHFDYVNPDAPKGGLVRFAALGTFDTLNGVPVEGTAAGGLGLIYDGLMAGTLDESNSQYCLLCTGLRYADDFSWATYQIRDDAYWHDGTPITVEDFIWTFDILKENDPNVAQYYSHVERLEQTGEWEMTFYFDEAGNRELPTIVGQLGPLPKHYWEGVDANGVQRDITQPTLVPPLGSGPYRIVAVDPGRTMEYERVENYWGAEHAVNIGMNNFDRVRIEYFLDETVEFEAFKADQYDFRSEYIARRWANEYNFPAAQEGRVILEWVETEIDYGEVVGYVWNTRRPQFQDPRVRQALSLAYPFEDLNRNLFFGQYIRTRSYWDGIDLAATGAPQGRELEILEGIRDMVPPEVFGEAYQAPVNDTPEQLRDNLRLALDLMLEAGWELRGNTLTNVQTGEPFVIEWLNRQPTLEAQALRYQEELRKIGIDFQIRTVDTSQFVGRVRAYDFDAIYTSFGQSNSPGNELYFFFGTEAAGQNGTPNYAGIMNPGVDAIIELIVNAPDREELVAATHALDRVLTYNYYFTFGYTLRAARIAYWDRFSHPENLPPYSIGFPSIWWYDEEKAARVGPAQ